MQKVENILIFKKAFTFVQLYDILILLLEKNQSCKLFWSVTALFYPFIFQRFFRAILFLILNAPRILSLLQTQALLPRWDSFEDNNKMNRSPLKYPHSQEALRVGNRIPRASCLFEAAFCEHGMLRSYTHPQG